MRRLSYVLAAGWVFISLLNVGNFLHSGLSFGLTGWILSLILGMTIYVTSYYARPKQTRWPAGIVMLLAMALDLMLNELEVTRVASVFDVPTKNFLGLSPNIISAMYQLAALAVGASQTFFAAGLGWLQSGVDKIPQKKAQNVGWIERIFPQNEAEETTGNGGAKNAKRKPSETNSEKSKRQPGERIHKNDLTTSDKAQIADETTAQIVAKFGGTLRRAEQWKQSARSGTL